MFLTEFLATLRLRAAALGDGSTSEIGWASGAISAVEPEIGSSSAVGTSKTSASQEFNFSANRSAQVFGASDTVQPQSLRALILVRAF